MECLEEIAESFNLRPNRPEKYNGKRDFLTLNTWIYKVDQYLSLSQISNPGADISEDAKTMFAASFLTETAAVWWFTLVQNNATPNTWQGFKQALLNEFIPDDQIRRARDRLRNCRQKGSAAKYISEYINIILSVPDISEGEKFDRFVDGLKNNVRLEVLKSTVATFEDATKIALLVDSALWREYQSGQNFSYGGQHGSAASSTNPTPMEIGNLQERGRRPLADKEKWQRQKDKQNNACFVCHTPNCRPYKCRGSRINNKEIGKNSRNQETEETEDPVLSDTESEN